MIRFLNKFFRTKKGQVPYSKDLQLPFEKQIEADSLESQRKYMEALAIYEGFLKGHPDSIQVLNNAAIMYIRMKIPVKAYRLLKKAIKLDPRYVKAWNNLATVKMMFGDVVGAEEAYQKVLELVPQNAIARKGLQNCQAIKTQIAEARVTGGVVKKGKTHFSDRNILVCAKCKKRYTEFGHWSAFNKVLGGALCRYCGKFYCEGCLSEILLGADERKQFFCACGKSKTWLGDDGQAAMDNFEELVVFHAESIPYANSLKVHSGAEQSHKGTIKTSAAQAVKKMKALLGARHGPLRECLSKCISINCGQPIVFLLPDRPVRGQLAQLVLKYECSSCKQLLFATTMITGQPVLATRCSIVNNQMFLENPVALETEDAGNVGLPCDGYGSRATTFFVAGKESYRNGLPAARLSPTAQFVVGRGRDGKMTLLQSGSGG
jgi:hypothetical protein